jgi:hemerythrin-like metal-binding protein
MSSSRLQFRTIITLVVICISALAPALISNLPQYLHWVCALVTMGASVGLGFGLMGILRRLALAKATAARYAKGDLQERIPASADGDEVDDLLAEINRMAEGLTEVLGAVKGTSQLLQQASQQFQRGNAVVVSNSLNVQTNSETIASAAEETSVSIQSITQNSNDLSGSVSTVAAAMEELGATAKAIEERSNESARTSLRAKEQAEGISKSILHLESVAKSIGGIVQLIDEVASQTNLLALNATIEAAGAGEAGKGFSVVAAEVKQLSRQTSQSTTNIRTQIEQMQAIVGTVISQVGQITKIVEDINRGSNFALTSVSEQRQALQDVTTSLAHASLSAGQIHKGLQEISLGATGTATNIGKIHQDMSDNLKNVKDAEVQSNAIADITKRLQGLLNSFRTAKSKYQLTPNLLTGVKDMDDQHRRLFALINQLADAIAEGRGNLELLPVIDGLAQYAVQHFKEEEAMLRRCSFPDFDAHCKIHRHFEETVTKARQDFAAGRGMIGSELVSFLSDWLVKHIGGQDKRYTKYAR